MSSAIGWKNFFQNGSYLSNNNLGNFTSCTVDPAYPLINLLNPNPQKTTRWNYTRNGSVGYILPVIYFSATNVADCRVFSIQNCRIPSTATDIYFSIYDVALSGLLDVRYLPVNLVKRPNTVDRYDVYAVSAVGISAGAMGLQVTVPASTTDYIEYGLPWASKGMVFSDGVDNDWQQDYVDPGEVDFARMSNPAFSVLPRLRTLDFSMSARSYAEMMGTPGTAANLSYRQFALECGKTDYALALNRYGTNTQALHEMQTMGVYGVVTSLPAAKHRGGNLIEISKFSIRQVA